MQARPKKTGQPCLCSVHTSETHVYGFGWVVCFQGHFHLVTPEGNNIPKWTPTTQSTDQHILQYTICCIQIEGDLKTLNQKYLEKLRRIKKYVLTGSLSHCRFYFDEPFRGRGKYSVFRVEGALRCTYSIIPYLSVSKVGVLFALRILVLEKCCCKTNREYCQFNNHINSVTLLCKYYTDGVTK